VAPNDFRADGVNWGKLGEATVTGGAGTITVVLGDSANKFVIADAVRLDPVFGSEITVLDGTREIGQGGTLDFGEIGQDTTTADRITRTITVRNDGSDDLILQTIPTLNGFTISNTNFTPGQVVAPGKTTSFDITIATDAAGVFTDVLEFGTNDSDESPFNFTLTGTITSDEPITGPEIEVLDGTTALTDGTSSINFGTALVGGSLSKVFTVNNVGTTDLTVQPLSVPDGFTIVSDFAADQVIPAETSATFIIGVSTSGAATRTGTLQFANNDTDENPFNFTISATVAAPAPIIIDNGDAGFTRTAGFIPFANQGFQNDVHFAASGGVADKASWTFVGLGAGTYRVSTTWTPHSSRATDAPYSINGELVRDVNQQLAPKDVSFSSIQDPTTGVFFADLEGSFDHTGGDLTVSLSDDANRYVIADAVRVEFLGPLSPLKSLGGEVTSSAETVDLTVNATTEIVTQAIAILSATDLTDYQVDALSTVTVEVRDLIDGHLGVASSDTIYLDVNGAGFGWFVDSTPLLSEEFLFTDGSLKAIPSGPAAGRIDLLTVVLHELGHVIGLDDLTADAGSNDVMTENLTGGVRRLPEGAAASAPLPTAQSSLDLESGESSSERLEVLPQPIHVGDRTPAELYAEGNEKEPLESRNQPVITGPSKEDANRIDALFSIRNEEETITGQIPFDTL
jgi:hypothetical protein